MAIPPKDTPAGIRIEGPVPVKKEATADAVPKSTKEKTESTDAGISVQMERDKIAAKKAVQDKEDQAKAALNKNPTVSQTTDVQPPMGFKGGAKAKSSDKENPPMSTEPKKEKSQDLGQFYTNEQGDDFFTILWNFITNIVAPIVGKYDANKRMNKAEQVDKLPESQTPEGASKQEEEVTLRAKSEQIEQNKLDDIRVSSEAQKTPGSSVDAPEPSRAALTPQHTHEKITLSVSKPGGAPSVQIPEDGPTIKPSSSKPS